METMNAKVRKWGNSFGIVLPKKFVNDENIKEGLEVFVTISPIQKTKVGNIFKLAEKMSLPKLKKSTQQLLDEVDEELWGED